MGSDCMSEWLGCSTDFPHLTTPHHGPPQAAAEGQPEQGQHSHYASTSGQGGPGPDAFLPCRQGGGGDAGHAVHDETPSSGGPAWEMEADTWLVEVGRGKWAGA